MSIAKKPLHPLDIFCDKTELYFTDRFQSRSKNKGNQQVCGIQSGVIDTYALCEADTKDGVWEKIKAAFEAAKMFEVKK